MSRITNILACCAALAAVFGTSAKTPAYSPVRATAVLAIEVGLTPDALAKGSVTTTQVASAFEAIDGADEFQATLVSTRQALREATANHRAALLRAQRGPFSANTTTELQSAIVALQAAKTNYDSARAALRSAGTSAMAGLENGWVQEIVNAGQSLRATRLTGPQREVRAQLLASFRQ